MSGEGAGREQLAVTLHRANARGLVLRTYQLCMGAISLRFDTARWTDPTGPKGRAMPFNPALNFALVDLCKPLHHACA